MAAGRVLILHNEVAADAGPADRDVLVQRDAVRRALTANGWDTDCLACGLNLQDTADRLKALQPDVVFNLVESLDGTDRLMSVVPLLLDALQVPYTGANTQAMLSASGKISTKQILRAHGLPTPDWWTTEAFVTDRPGNQWRKLPACGSSQSQTEGLVKNCCDGDFRGRPDDVGPEETTGFSGIGPGRPLTVIMKPVWEHASLNMDDNCVVAVQSPDEILRALRQSEQNFGRPYFAEAYIDGREFNLSLIQDDSGTMRVLPPAEIDFCGFPPDKPRIVGHRAKWQETSFEYEQTPRRFEFPLTDTGLLRELKQLTQQCRQAFDLTGYARVDFRIDADGCPWILEVNVNPCLSPDAGFAAALQTAGIDFDDAMHWLVQAAVCGHSATRVSTEV
ncbi:MAG: hypothetical protein KDA89_08315 [Planctomycetaceae bacterium]|nr:hypothetical protein [Planctomycetaceae bacterium]